jgi:hypothetical protein
MPVIRMTSEGTVYDVDVTRLTLGEAIVLQEHTGLDMEGLGDLTTGRNLPAMGAVMWLMRLRQITAEQQCTTKVAAGSCPHDRFVDTLDIISMTVEVLEDPKAPAARTRTTRTPPTGSSRPRKRTKAAASGGSELSPST